MKAQKQLQKPSKLQALDPKCHMQMKICSLQQQREALFKLLGLVQPELGLSSALSCTTSSLHMSRCLTLPAAHTDICSLLQFGELTLPGPAGQGGTQGSDTGAPPEMHWRV